MLPLPQTTGISSPHRARRATSLVAVPRPADHRLCPLMRSVCAVVLRSVPAQCPRASFMAAPGSASASSKYCRIPCWPRRRSSPRPSSSRGRESSATRARRCASRRSRSTDNSCAGESTARSSSRPTDLQPAGHRPDTSRCGPQDQRDFCDQPVDELHDTAGSTTSIMKWIGRLDAAGLIRDVLEI